MDKKNTHSKLLWLCLVGIGLSMGIGCAEVPNKAEIKESIQNQLKLLDKPPEPEVSFIEKKDNIVPKSQPKEKNNEVKKLTADMWSERQDGVSSIVVQFHNGIPYPALFKRGEYLYLAFSYATEISTAKWVDSTVPEVTDLEILKSDDVTLARWKIANIFPKLTIDPKANRFIVTFLEKEPDRAGFDIEIFQPRRRGDSFEAKLKNAQTDVSFTFDETGKTLWIICADGQNRPIKKRDYPEFDILESFQGLAFDLKSDALEYSYLRKTSTLTKSGGIANSTALVDLSSQVARNIFDDYGTQGPNQSIENLIRKVYQDRPNLEDGVNLVWAYLSKGLALESQNVISGLNVKNPDLTLSALWRTMSGLTALTRGRYSLAQSQLASVRDEPDVDYWFHIAKCCATRTVDNDSVAQVIAGKRTLMKLPDNLRDKLWDKILEFGLIQEQKKILEEYTLKGDIPTTRLTKQIYDLASTVLQLTPDNIDAINKLYDMSKELRGTKVGVMAGFERVKYLHQIKKIQPDEEVMVLNDLRFQWRGDDLEYRITKYLIDRYMEHKQYAKILSLARKTIKYYTKESHEDGLPQIMQEALVKYFEQDNIPILEMLSVFQEFTSIAPDNEHGDRIMIRATNVLANLELYDVVVTLLKDYLALKAKEGDDVLLRQEKIKYRMAVAYHLNRNYDQALKILEEIKGGSENLRDKIAILKSEAYLHLGHKERAIAALGDNPVQLLHKAEIIFSERNWAEAQNLYHKLLYGSDQLSEEDKERSLINYALCLYVEKKSYQLQNLHKDFVDFMEDKKGRDAFDLLTLPDASISMRQLESIQQVDKFADRLKSVFKESDKV